MSETPSMGTESVDETPKPPKSHWPTLIEWLVISAIMLIFATIPLFVSSSTCCGSGRTHCMNRMKNVVLALHSYHSSYHAFPPAYTVDSDGNPLHSWRTLILPYLDQRELYEMIDLSKAWDDPANAAARKYALEEGLYVYRCQSNNTFPMQTNYLAVVTYNSCLRPGQSATLEEITDGLENTLLLIEVDNKHAVNWMSPWDADEQTLLELGGRFSPPHEGVILGAFADGRVHRLDVNLAADVRRGLISIDGNEDVAVE